MADRADILKQNMRRACLIYLKKQAEQLPSEKELKAGHVFSCLLYTSCWPFLCSCSTAQLPWPFQCRHGACRWNWHSELPRRRGYFIAVAPRRAFCRTKLYIWKLIGRGGICVRCCRGAGGGIHPTAYASSSFLCGRGHDVCGCGRVDSGSKAR